MYSLNLIEAREVFSAHYTGEKESVNAEEVKQYVCTVPMYQVPSELRIIILTTYIRISVVNWTGYFGC